MSYTRLQKVRIHEILDKELAKKIKHAFSKKNRAYSVNFDYEKNLIVVYFDSKIKRASEEIKLVLFNLNISFNIEEENFDNISNSSSEKLPLISDETNTTTNKRTVSVRVTGMHCSSCQSKIEAQLRRMPGVINATVQLMTGEAVVDFDSEVIKETKEIVKCIRNMGYKAESSKISVDTASDYLFIRFYDESYENRQNCLSAHSSGSLCKDLVSKFDSVIEAVVFKESNLIRIKYDKTETTKKSLFNAINSFYTRYTIEAEQLTLESTHLSNVKEQIKKWRRQTVLTSCLGVPSMAIMIFQMAYTTESKYEVVPGLSVSNLVLFIISLLAQIFCAYHYYLPCFRGFCSRPGMDTLIALASFVAFFYSLFVQLAVVVVNVRMSKTEYSDGGYLTAPHTFFETPQMLMMFISIGKMLESMAKLRTMDSIAVLDKMQPKLVDVLVSPKSTETVNVSLVEKGDVVRVMPYSVIPLDGYIQNEDSFEIDESLLTGESAVRTKNNNQTVYAGSKNMSPKILYLKVSHSVGDSVIGQLAKSVSQALLNRAPIQKLADVIGGYFVLVIIVLSVFTCACWLLVAAFTNFLDNNQSNSTVHTHIDEFFGSRFNLTQDEPVKRMLHILPFAVKSAINVLCVACPCALGLATPTAVMVACGTGALNKILFKGGDVIQKTAKLAFVCFDKTGTLTRGNFCVTKTVLFNEKFLDRFVMFLVGLSENSVARSHPIGKALINHSLKYFEGEEDVCKYITTNSADFCTLQKGLGCEIKLSYCKLVALLKVLFKEQTESVKFFEETFSLSKGKNFSVLIGNEKFVYAEDPPTTAKTKTKVHIRIQTEHTNKRQLLFELSDEVRGEAKKTVNQLHKLNIQTAMITGDCEAPANYVARKTNIEIVHFSCLPHNKAEIVKNYMKTFNSNVAMVGDGVNDSVAMVSASVGVSLASGSDLANATADIVLNDNNLTDLLNAIDLSKKTMYIVKRNIFLSIIYNLVAVPVAAGCLEPVGVNVQPWMASIAMSVSSLSVVLSSLTLKKYKKKFFY